MAYLRLRHVQLFIGLVTCLVGLSYWLFWQTGLSLRPILIGTWFHLETNISLNCLSQLQYSFGIEAFDAAVPTYVRLAKPAPISRSCRHLFAATNSTKLDLSKVELLSAAEQAKLHELVHELYVNFTQRNLELFLAGGSLLGSVRHFGFFPWDADADLMIPQSQKPQIRQLLIDLSASDEFRFVDTERTNEHWQLGIFCQAERGKPLTRMYGTDRLYPSKTCKTIVDFFFGRKDSGYYRRPEYPHSFPIEHVYPLTLRPYGPYLIPAPRRADKFLSAVYGKEYEADCQFKYFKNQKSLRCADLRSIHPFVTHLVLPYGSISLQLDVLVQNSRMLAVFIPQRH